MEGKQEEKSEAQWKPPRLNSAAALGPLNEKYYGDLASAREVGKPVVWVTSMAPIELVFAFDGIPFFPENYSALCSSRKVAAEFVEAGEGLGYAPGLCSYALNTFGFIHLNRGAFGDGAPPPPDVLLATEGACITHVKWWEALQRHYNCPLIMVDAAYVVDSDTLSDHEKSYLAAELQRAAHEMERHTGRKFDMDKLREVVALSDRTSELWDEIDEMRAAVPCPVSQIDVFTVQFPLVTLKGTRAAVEFYEPLRDEIRQRVDDGIGFLPNERFRLMWDLFPVFHNLRLLNYFAQFDATFVADMYGNAFSGRLDSSEPFGSLAERYLSFFMRSASLGKAQIYKERVRRYHVDGMVFHANRCCRCFSAEQPELGRILREELDMPSMVFEADMVDPRVYDDAQIKARIEAFMEMLEARKYPR
jgi:benzoyl-CoA reductase/2-hydroxyglutaryl-CoA dehydratase subunit BcrC/BadD/HgdB